MKIQRTCNENAMWRLRRNSIKMQGGTLIEINGNVWTFNKIQWKYMKIQRKYNENAMWRLRWNSMKLQGVTLIEINENQWTFNKNQWKYTKIQRKYNENTMWRLRWNPIKLQGGYPYRNQLKFMKISWNSMNINENTKKMQRKYNVAASPKFNEIARGYRCRNQWKSMKIQWNSIKTFRCDRNAKPILAPCSALSSYRRVVSSHCAVCRGAWFQDRSSMKFCLQYL